MLITKRHLSRRTVLKGMGVTAALPLLEAMIPAGTACAKTAAKGKVRLAAIEMVHGAAGSSAYGAEDEHVVAGGHRPQLRPDARARCRRSSRCASTSPSSATPTCAWPRRSRRRKSAATTSAPAPCSSPRRIPKQTMGSDVRAGISLDQLYAQRFGQDTPIPVDAAVHRAGRSGRRLRIRLLVRLHRLDQLGLGRRNAAADDSRPAHGVRSALRRGRHQARSARSAARRTAASSTR